VEDQRVTYITFDMQKTLPLPKLSTSIAFHLRQIWLSNVGIHLVQKMWIEHFSASGPRMRPAVVVKMLGVLCWCSWILLTWKKVLVAWSDSCAGQKKNFYISKVWQYLVAKNRFQVIHHKFPETGHSYMDSDRDFAHVEKAVQQHQSIYHYHSILW